MLFRSQDRPHFWIELDLAGEVLYVDPSEGTGNLCTAREFFEQGYRWPDGQEEAPEGEKSAAGPQKEEEKTPETQ